MQPQAVTKVSISALLISLPIIYVSLLRVPPSALARDSTFWFLMSNSIIAIIAADSGVLFLSNDDDDDDDDDDPLDVVTTEQPVATVDYYRDDTMSVPLMPTSHEQTVPAGVVVGGDERLMGTGGAASFEATDSTGGMEEGHAPALIEHEGAAGKPSTDILVVTHASVLQRSEEEPAAPEPEPAAANKNNDDAPQDEGYVVEGEQVKPRSSLAEMSKPPRRQKEEQREYWQLSDEELNRKVEEFIARFNRDMVEQEAAAV